MRIQDYNFGQIKIDGQIFTSDVIVLPDGIEENWWRSEGHQLIPADLSLIDEIKPEILVVGQGKFGCLQISKAFYKYLNDMHIELVAENTEKAIKIYNELWSKGTRNLMAALHLTC